MIYTVDEILNQYSSLETAELKYQFFCNVRNIFNHLNKLTEELTYCRKCKQHIFIKDLIEKFDVWEDLEDENAGDPLEQAKWIKVKRDGFRKHCPLCDGVIAYC